MTYCLIYLVFVNSNTTLNMKIIHYKKPDQIIINGNVIVILVFD